MNVRIKGTKDGLLITLDEGGEWEQVRLSLLDYLDKQANFLKSGETKEATRLILDVGARTLKAAELGALRDQISERGLTLWAVLSSSAMTEGTAQVLGLATRIHTARTDSPFPSQDTAATAGETALFLRRTLRSGTRIEHPGHVVIFGDVHPGAEIIASGDVIVWGRLKGLVHAGAEGDESAVVCALELTPTQLRIAEQIAISPKERHRKPHPEIACIQDGQVVASPWQDM